MSLKDVPRILFIVLFCTPLLSSQSLNQNQVTIRDDRVILLNGRPFFPIGVCCEREDLFDTLIDNGFNYINLFSENHFLYSDSCGFDSRNIISGDVTTNIQYNEMLGKYASDLRWDQNARRIFNYIGKDNFYIFADDYTFYPDDNDSYIINLGSCGDSLILNPKFNQTVRDQSADRLVNISNWQGNKLMGVYVKDDANMFEVGYPDPTYYYDTYFHTRINNFKDTYDRFKKGYPNSLVMLNLAACFFPRAMKPQLWPNVNIAREAWINDALQYVQSCDVLFSPGVLSYESSDTAWVIYSNRNPSWYPDHLQQTVFGRLLPKNKAAFGGLLFDSYLALPHPTDPAFLRKIKWEIYVGLEKGCTGLIFFGWHKLARPDGEIAVMAWNYVKNIIHEMVKQLHLDENVFIKTNSGQVGHSISGSYSNNVSYAVYNVNGWNDYYMLVTNNPNESLYATEPDNTVSISCDRNLLNWDNGTITEVFSGRNVQVYSGSAIQYTMPCCGTALFHVQSNQVPSRFSLSQNYPNPFNPSTIINYQLSISSNVKLIIYDVLGREVKTLVNEKQNAGIYQVKFDGMNFPSGVYFYKLSATGGSGTFSQSRKMVLVK